MRLACWWSVLWIVGAAPAAVTVQVAEEAPGETYRLSGSLLAPPAALARGELRLAFDWTDAQNHYYAKLSGEQAQFFRVQRGQTSALGLPGKLWRARPTDPLAFSLQRGEWAMVLCVNAVVAARAEDRSLPPGAAGHGVSGAGLAVESFEAQPTEEIYFSDDFMRTDAQLGGWEPLVGQWENNQQGSKASRSANAFSFRSVGATPGLAACGYPFWTDYTAQAAVRCDGHGAVGLAVGVQGAAACYRLRWTAQQSADGGTCRLQRVWGGQVSDLTPALPGGFRAGVWYKLQLTLAGGRLLACIDDVPLVEVAVQALTEGRVGLYTEPGEGDTAETGGALFDDALVRSMPLLVDDFSAATATRYAAQGAWGWTTGGAVAPAEGSLLSGLVDGAEVHLAADLSGGPGQLGLVVHRGADGSGYELRLAADKVRLLKVGPGGETLLDQGAPPAGADPVRVELSYDRGLLRGTVDHRPLLEAFDLSLPAGAVGVVSRGGAGRRVDNLRASFRPLSWTLPPTVPAEFSTDEYMTNWASPAAAWVTVEGTPGRWHKGFFYGDRQIALQIPGFGQQAGTVQVVLGAASTDVAAAWRLELTLARTDPKLQLALRRGDQTVATATPTITAETPRLVFELRGRHMLVWVDDQNVLQYRLPEDAR
ncbi:MAG: hypothetical protein IT204_00295 [Fimbriimonadaceae bacterium]|nr:hypothetical protein [Fimbriimonadaceae bacterium]